jgi:hypothetical protein
MRILFARMVDESTSCFHSLQELGARQQAGIGGSTTTEFFWVTFQEVEEGEGMFIRREHVDFNLAQVRDYELLKYVGL